MISKEFIMKKSIIVLSLVLVVLFTVVFVGCSAKNNDYNASLGYEPADSGESMDKAEVSTTIGTNERKIIYTATAGITVENLQEATDGIRGLLNDTEWVESSRVSEYGVRLVLRVSNSRLNTFMSSLSEFGDVKRSEITSEDVSLKYYDTSLRKQTLETEYARLNTLLNSTENIGDILTINKRLAEIESELQDLQKTLNNYDSLIEYSRVTIELWTKETPQKEASFGDKVGTGYSISGKVLEALALFFIVILPYLAFAGLIVVLVIVIRRAKKKKKAQLAESNIPQTVIEENVVNLNENSNYKKK